MWGLGKKVDELEALVLDRCNNIEDGLKKVIARGEIVDILRTELELMREERKELLNRLMARNFETLQTYTLGKEGEEEMVEIPLEENENIAGEVLSITN